MRILSSLRTSGPGVTHHDFGPGRRRLHSRIAAFVSRAADFDAVVLNGAVSLDRLYDQLIAARAVARRYPRMPVVLADCTWEAGSRAVSRVLRSGRPLAVDSPGEHLQRSTRLAIRGLRSPNLHCCVLSSYEQAAFPDSWGFDPAHVHFTPYWSSNLEALSGAAGEERGRFVFAGGDSMRDFRPLLGAAAQISAEIVIATRLPMPASVPANVTVGPVPQERYAALAASACVTVVPLIADAQRSGGQKTYLGAMALGQAVVVPAAPGVTDYVRPGQTGLVPPADDVDALAGSINQVLADPARGARLGAAARADVRTRFSRSAYAGRLYGLAADLAS